MLTDWWYVSLFFLRLNMTVMVDWALKPISVLPLCSQWISRPCTPDVRHQPGLKFAADRLMMCDISQVWSLLLTDWWCVTSARSEVCCWQTDDVWHQPGLKFAADRLMMCSLGFQWRSGPCIRDVQYQAGPKCAADRLKIYETWARSDWWYMRHEPGLKFATDRLMIYETWARSEVCCWQTDDVRHQPGLKFAVNINRLMMWDISQVWSLLLTLTDWWCETSARSEVCC